MLKNLSPLLTADLLHALRSMGHGDEVLICDVNFPAFEVATHTTSKRLIQLSVSLPEAIDAILSVFPVDCFVPTPIYYMCPDQGLTMPAEGRQVVDECILAIKRHSGDVHIAPRHRSDFYGEARKVFFVLQTVERRPYANFVVKKGVIGPDGKDLKPKL